MRRFLFITGAVLIFTACSVKNSPSEAPIPERIASPMPTLTPVMEPTQGNSTESLVRPTDPRELMLNSHQYWQSLFVDTLLKNLLPGQPLPIEMRFVNMGETETIQAVVHYVVNVHQSKIAQSRIGIRDCLKALELHLPSRPGVAPAKSVGRSASLTIPTIQNDGAAEPF